MSSCFYSVKRLEVTNGNRNLYMFSHPIIYQGHGGTSANGWIVDYNNIFGREQRYLYERNLSGAGYSLTLNTGHSSFLSNVHPPVGYNGRFGYRRNTPSLRNKSSCFGEISPFPFH
ncbi:sperm microtubule associated protein 1 [Eleutherodactylus coqui]|uniref:Uncharacterized protein n=1 Tax=Eleutherodactylus coqui TaxID=57060 RepID=A0A8J6EQR5_ELECQ|nr:hypothetical protein GDO78_004387 [Eleutherodactylus coqui]